MKFRFLILFFSFFIFYQSGNCQNSNDDYKQIDDSKVNPTNLAISRFQIYDLKSRGIIVRLRTDKNRIDAYRKAGNTKVADKVAERTRLTNLMLMYSFIINWSYSPVYFMESQYTDLLEQKDTLMAKTADLKRDTAIYMNHDSVYVVDYGQLIVNYYDGGKSSNPTDESGTVESGWFLIVKDHELNQMQNPLPYKAKVWGDGFGPIERLHTIEFPKDLLDSIYSYTARYSDVNEMLHTDAKSTLFKFLMMIYDHVSIGETGGDGTQAATRKKISIDPDQASTKKIYGTPYTQAALRLNNHFIHYYCDRLDKDKNLLCNNELLYWWLRNPNIKYLIHLPDLEAELKRLLDKEATFTKIR